MFKIKIKHTFTEQNNVNKKLDASEYTSTEVREQFCQ